jgi:hypothetical protein
MVFKSVDLIQMVYDAYQWRDEKYNEASGFIKAWNFLTNLAGAGFIDSSVPLLLSD